MQEIISSLNHIDKQWLLALNNDYSSFWDNFMWLVSAKLTWVPFYISLIFVVFKNWKKEGWLLIIGLVICVLLADWVASGVLKDAVQRLRPSRDPSLENMVVLVNGYRGGKYGFASSHAATTFALALLSSLFFKNRIYTCAVFCWAALVAYSRIFLGVHYPGDVIGGAVIGCLSALLIFFIIKKVRPNLELKANLTIIPIIVLSATVLVLITYSLL